MLKISNRLAYTLPELLITILLLGILVSLSMILSANMNQTNKLRNYSVAVAMAQQAIEIVRSAPYELIDDADAGENSVETDLNTKSGPADTICPEFNSGFSLYTRSVEITDIKIKEDNKRSAGLKHLKVTVKWSLDGGKPETYVVQTTVADLN